MNLAKNKSTKKIFFFQITIILLVNIYLNFNNLNIVILETLQNEYKIITTSNNIKLEEFSVLKNVNLLYKIFFVSETQQNIEFVRLTSSKLLTYIKFSVFSLSFFYFKFIRSKFKYLYLNLVIFFNFMLNIFLYLDFSYWNTLQEIFILILLYEYSINKNKINLSLNVPFLIFFILLTVIFLYKIFNTSDEYLIWGLLNIPHLSPSFIDMRLLQSSLISLLNGYDPFLQNPFDSKGRLYAATEYLLLFSKAISLQNENVFNFLLVLLVIFYIFSIFYLSFKYKSFYFLFFLFSYASLLCIERGQPDLIIYSLLFSSMFLNKKFSGVLVMFASIFKLFPIITFINIFIIKSKIWILYLITTLCLLAINLNSILLLQQNIFSTYRMSFGFKSFYLLYLDNKNTAIISIFLFLILIIKKYFSGNLINKIDFEIFNFNEVYLFLIGASIYCGLFIATSSFDYKLIFLIFCLPLLIKLNTSNTNFTILIFLIVSNYGFLVNVFGNIGLIITVIGKFYIFLQLLQMQIQIFLNRKSLNNHLL